MLLLQIALLLVIRSNETALNERNILPNRLASTLIGPHHVRIQHMNVITHRNIVIDTYTPHFSWQLADEYGDDTNRPIRGVQQMGYHILVHNVGTGQRMWDSEQVRSSSSSHILYRGALFTSDTRYTVSIKYYTEQHESQWYTAPFRTALFSLTDWMGEWIGSDDINMNQLRTVANLKSVTIQSATAFISGIGYYHLYIEGQLIDPSRRLDVGWTTYQQRTLYTSFDLTNAMNSSTEHIGIGIVLGQGWYNRQQWEISLGAHNALAEQYGRLVR